MSYSNGLLSSPTTSSTHGPPGPPGVGFKLTGDGNYDIDGKRLTNVSQPIDAREVATKAYIDGNKLDVVLRDGSQNMTGNLDMNNNKITSLADSTDDNEAVSLKVLKNYTQFHQNNYHLQPSFKIYKDFGDKSQLTIGSPPNTPSNHFFQNHKSHHDAYTIDKENGDTGFGGQAWSSMKMEGNQLESGSYTSIFEVFVISDTNSFLVDDTIIYHVYGDSHHTITTFNSNKINGQYTKSMIQFTTDGRAGVNDGIKFQIKYFGSKYNKTIKFLFYSRVVKGSQSTSFNHNIFNVNDVDDNHEILYFENLNLNGNLINGLGNPVDDADAVNKKYVDGENTKQNIAINHNSQIIGNSLFHLDGSKKMTGDLDMDGHNILSVKNFTDHKVDDAYSNIVKDLKSVVNKEYLNQNFLKIKGNDYDLNQRVIKNSAPHDDGSYDNNTLVSKAFVDAEIAKLPKPDTDVLKLDGSKSMTGNLNMGNKKIKNLKDPVNYQDAATKNYVEIYVGVIESYLLPKDGSEAMQGNLDMNNNGIKNLKDPVNNQDAETKKWINTQLNTKAGLTYTNTQLAKKLDLSGGNMAGDINMANNSIINLKEPEASDSNHAASVKFVNTIINNSESSMINLINDKIKESEEGSIEVVQQENVFKKVMDDEFKEDDNDIHKVGVRNKNFHLVNKKTYEFKIDYDSSLGYYSTRLSIDLIYLPVGSYTMVYEMYIDNGITVDEIDATSGTLVVGKINSKIDGTKTRSIIHFTKYTISPGFDDLDIDIKLKGKTDPQTTINVVVYGVKGLVNNVSVNFGIGITIMIILLLNLNYQSI